MSAAPFGLPEIEFCTTDAAEVERQVVLAYEVITGLKLFPGAPERLFCEAMAYIIAQQRTVINDSAKMNLLAYARGSFLDHIGALTDTNRLPASSARTTLRFSIGQALAFPAAIPAGTRATPDGKLFFGVSQTAEIPAGQLFVEVEAVCMAAGKVGNGFVAGQINRLVDPIAYVTSVENVTLALGGSDPETDDHFRDRIHLSPEKYSTAGPDGAYEFWAMSAHQDIIDVAVYSPSPGAVNVRPLMKGGVLPDQGTLDLVEAALSARERRPLTDNLTVASPEQVSYDIDLTYYLEAGQANLAAALQTAVQNAVDAFVSWQGSKLGRDINPSHLIHLVQSAGAKRVIVTSPVYQALNEWEIAAANSVTVTYGGVEDE